MEDIIYNSNKLSKLVSSLSEKKKLIPKDPTVYVDQSNNKLSLDQSHLDQSHLDQSHLDQTQLNKSRSIKIKAYVTSDKYAFYYSGYKTGDCTNDLFYKILSSKKAKHISTLESSEYFDNIDLVNYYKTPFDHLGFSFKNENITCYINGNISFLSDVIKKNKPAYLTLRVIPYDFTDKKRIVGLYIIVDKVEI